MNSKLNQCSYTKRTSCLLLILLAVLTTIDAQPEKSIARKSLYLEGASKGASYSLNYDRVFHYGTKMAHSYRVGLCLLNNTIAVPLGIQFFSGQESHHLEYSLTLVPYIEKYRQLFNGTNISDKKMFIIPGIGYRFQQPGGGFFAKLVTGPVIYLDPASDNFWRMEGKIYPGITAGAGLSF